MKRVIALIIPLFITALTAQAQRPAQVARGHGKPLITVYELPPADLNVYSSRYGIARASYKGKWGWVDTRFRIAIPFRYNMAQDFSGDLALVELNGKKGLINQTGNTVLPCMYDDISHDGYIVSDDSYYNSSERFIVRIDSNLGIVDGHGRELWPVACSAIVNLGGVSALYMKDSLPKLINSNLKVISDPSAGYKVGDFWTSRVVDGVFAVNRKKWGFMDTTGQLVIDCKYDRIRDVMPGCILVAGMGASHYIDKNGNNRDSACNIKKLSFHNGYTTLRDGNKLGLQDSSGHVIVPAIYDRAGCEEISGWCQNAQRYIPLKRDKKWGVARIDGHIVTPCIYDYLGVPGNDYFPVELNEKWGIVDTTGRLVIACEYSEVKPFTEGLANVRQGKRWGYADTTGKLVIPCRFSNPGDFSKGRAFVGGEGLDKIIDRQGNTMRKDPEPGISRAYGFHEGLAKIRDMDGYYGFINRKWETALPCNYEYAGDFHEGLAVVKMNELYGYIDKSGNLVIPCIYDGALDFSGNAAPVEKDGMAALIDRNGALLVPFLYKQIGTFKYGRAAIGNDKTYGFIDKSGVVVIDTIYEFVYEFTDGLAAVYLNGHWGFIDTLGHLIIDTVYDRVTIFNEGLAIAKKEEDGCFFIDKSGKQAFPGVFNSASVFREGLGIVKDTLWNKYGMIDRQGRTVVPYCFKDMGEISEGLIAGRSYTGYGLLNTKGEIMAPFHYDDIGEFSEGLAPVRNDDLWGYMNKKGKIVKWLK